MSHAESASSERKSLPKRKWLFRLVLAGGIFLLLCVSVVIGVLRHYDDEWFKQQITEALKKELGREIEIQAARFQPLSGSFSIENLTVFNPGKNFSEKHTLKLGRASAKLDVLPALMSSGRKICGLSVELEKPELLIEYRGKYPMESGNIDDLIRKFMSGPPSTWPKQTGLQALDFSLTVRGGVLRYIDSNKQLGESRIEQLDTVVRMPALGQPLEIKSSLNLVTNATPKGGTADIEGRINWIGTDGSINPESFKDVLLSANLKEFDFPYLCRHVHIQGSLVDGQFQWAPGRPFTGVFKLEAATLEQVKVTASIETDGAISILEKGKRVAGDVPGRFDLEIQGGYKNGRFHGGPSKFSTWLTATRASLTDPSAPRYLDWKIEAGADDGKSRKFTIVFKNKLTDLFATDAGIVLGLNGQIGGNLDGTVDASFDRNGQFSAKGELHTQDGFVAIEGVRQPSKMDMTFAAGVFPNADGIPESANVELSAKADSFQVQSIQPISITSLSDPRNIKAESKLNLLVKGREFWKQFGPLLKVLNMSTPLEEELAGELSLTGSAGKVALALKGKLSRQAQPAMPIQLEISADYDGGQLVDAPASPFLTFKANVNSDDKTIHLRAEGSAIRGKTEQRFMLPVFENESDLHALTLFNRRFGAYVSVFPGSNYSVSGVIKQSGTSYFHETFGADGKVASTEISLKTDLKLSKLNLTGPPVKPGAFALKWQDDNIDLNLGLNLKNSAAGGALVLQPLRLNSDMLTIQGDLAEASVEKLKAAFLGGADSIKLWINALPQCKVEARLSGKAVEQLQSCAILPAEPLYSGELNVSAEYDPKSTSASIGRISLNGPLLAFRASTEAINIPSLAAALNSGTPSMAKLGQLIPTIALSLRGQRGVLPRLTKLGFVPALPVDGDFSVSLNFDDDAKLLRINQVQFAGDELEATLSAAAMDIAPLATYLDLEPARRDTIALAGTLPDCVATLKCKPPLVAKLGKNISPLLANAGLHGEYAFSAKHVRADDHIELNGKVTLPIGSCELACAASLKKAVAKLASPVELLSNGLKSFSISNLKIDTRPVLDSHVLPVLSQYYQSGNLTFAATLLSGSLALKPSAKAGTFDLASSFQTGFAWSSNGQVLFKFGNVVKVDSLRITPTGESLSAEGTLDLSGTDMTYSTFTKPAGTACKLSLDATVSRSNSLRVNTLNIVSGERALSLNGAICNFGEPKPRVSFERAVVQDGGLRANVIGFNLDMVRDELTMRCEAEKLDLAAILPALQLNPSLTLKGTLAGLSASYSGRASTVMQGALAPTDNVSVVCQKADIELARTAGGKIAQLILSTDLKVSQKQARVEQCSGNVKLNRSGSISEQVFTFSASAAPRLEADMLLAAAQKPGLPLDVNLKFTSANVIDVAMLEDALAVLSGPAPSGGGSGVGELVLRASFSAPGVNSGTIVIKDVKMPTVSLAQNTAAVTGGQFSIYEDGLVTIKRESFNLQNNAHAGEIEFSNINLHTASGGGAGKANDEYQIHGRTLGSVTLSGTGFSAAERRTWNGKASATLAGLTALKNGGKASTDAGKVGIGLLGGVAGGLLGNRLGQKIDWLTSLYSEDFGLFLNKLEFEDYRVGMSIENGRAKLERSRLVGKGRSIGLQLDIAGGIDIPSEHFAPNLTIWIISLPPTTQKVLRLDQIDAADRDTILKEFADGKFKPVVLTRSISNYKDNRYEIASAFNDLDDRIEKLIQAKKARENPAPPNPNPGPNPNPAPNATPEKPKTNPLNDIFNLINKK